MSSELRKRAVSLGETAIETATVSRGSRGKLLVTGTSSGAPSGQRGRLCRYEELPAWQQDNDCIRTGYVRETLSVRRCLGSLLYWNNESVNMYSHLVPAVLYIAGATLALSQWGVPRFPTTTWSDYLIINTFLVGAGACLLCSSLFHCLKQHSERHCEAWSRMDYMGIILLIACSTIPMIYFGYFDYMGHCLLFTAVTVALGVACSGVVLFNKQFNSSSFKLVRAAFFIAFAFNGLIPMATGFVKFGIPGVLDRISLKYVWFEAVFYIAGAMLYGFRVPEIWIPGKVDLWGNSHQMFHVMVVFGSLCHLKAVLESYSLMHRHLA
ncbi:hemolysin III family protein KNAG_0K02160 [Huiozyma naganishii CBS 8797]|uniref:Uncharacterized protein n=1 Tax=Huiozyma naganishii (strain ATCC MYA-139 / BCRC 22969 / CBS 8797 / KCTC 17520 / NBRC 10181 / NCYC 3082 / Yp74L-3) TaxID=1071383 RepID=J7SAA2_HUIN7|nr:hypothetical protein KNAG_0K02160 [Kazachstania naganishii CBS 8797]CCK72579.1 hypothetical protein KNAG_0K02160 [Kazachstania naganishii CBS 8797]